MVLRNTTLVPPLGLHIGPACEAGLSAGMRREHVSPQIRKKESIYNVHKFSNGTESEALAVTRWAALVVIMVYLKR